MATVYYGQKWGDGTFGTAGGTVTYSFGQPFSPTFYSYTAQLDASYQAIVTYAFEQWETYADIDFVLSYDVVNADIILGWDYIDGYYGTVGEAYYTYNPRTDEIDWAEIRFDMLEDWGLTNDTTSYWQTSFYAVALHEIGHAIGLDHTSVMDSIMYPTEGFIRDLTPTDIAGIQALYGAGDVGWVTWTDDFGGWNYGWHQGGAWNYGWHLESGWDYGWFNGGTGWQVGWSFHIGWEQGWYGTGSWLYGWYFDYGGFGEGGTNIGWQDYGWYGGSLGHESFAPPPPTAWTLGYSFDDGGWNYGWYQKGEWGWGWHIEGGWDHGWFETGAGWDYGWFIHEGWEFGWYGTGAWRFGWYYDYGGTGWGWNIGWENYGWTNGWGGNESYI